MAVSADGYMARKEDDDMSWLGSADKAVFRALSAVGGVCGVGRRTISCMPNFLPGRTLIGISGSGQHPFMNLKDFDVMFPQAWLIGGPTVAWQAVMKGLVTEAHICRSDRKAFPSERDGPIEDTITPLLVAQRWVTAVTTRVMDVRVEVWRRGGSIVDPRG